MAQAYELGALSTRKKTPAIYQFNLLTVVDAEMFRLMFNGTKIDATPIKTEQYLTRYIVRKRETYSRLRFIHVTSFANELADYSRLHQANCEFFGDECNAFYVDVLKDYKRVGIYEEEFVKNVKWVIYSRVTKGLQDRVTLEEVAFFWREDDKTLVITPSSFDKQTMEFMNQDAQIQKVTTNALLEIYRYVGLFVYGDDIPF